jgi:hypothetical protein
MASKTALSAIELGVFTALGSGPLDAGALRQRLGIHKRSAVDFFDALVALGLLDRDAAGRYANTAESEQLLVRGKPGYAGGFFEMLNGRLYGFWGALTEALKTGRPQNESKGGGDLFAALYADPQRLETFLRAMTGVSLPLAAALAERFPWQRCASVIDIGAAQGCVPVQLALAHKHLTAGGFDLPTVRPVFEAYAREHGVADRVRFHPGNFLEEPLPRAEVLVMGHVLHDWDLATKKALLAKAHAALPPGGTLIVYELLIDDARRVHVPGLMMSLNMLIETSGGFDFTGADCIAWMREAGFADARVEPLAAAHSMVIATKA